MVTTHTQALEIVGYYKARWIIEDLFRTVKTEGVNYEASELETGPALRKHALFEGWALAKDMYKR